MNTLNFSISKSKVFGGFDIMIVRFSLMVSEFTCSAGDLYFGIMADRNLGNEKKTTKAKFDLIIAQLRENPASVETSLEEVEQTQMMYRFLMTVKFKSPDQIKNIRAIEKFVDAFYSEMSVNMSQNFARAGMTQLNKFVGNELTINAINIEDPELNEERGECAITLSEVLLDKFDTQSTDYIYLVTGHFSEYLKTNNLEIAELGSKISKKANILRAHNVLMLPPVITLTTDEIEIVRGHLMTSVPLFGINMDKWSKDLLKLPFVPDNFNDIAKQYVSDIFPHLQQLQAEIDRNDRLQLKQDRTENKIEFKISLYVCEIGLYWDYLTHIEAVGEDTLRVLKEYPNSENLRKKSCLIIEGNIINPEEDERNASQPMVLTKRKERE